MPSDAAIEAEDECPRCGKRAPLCVCDGIEPIGNRIHLLILQHPQEQDRDLGTARLATICCRNATLRIGLSWPSLAAALGRAAEPRRWAVLYLGSARAAELAPGREVVLLDGKGAPLGDQDAAMAELEGIVLLDGSWSQAKALWWRNPWVLKARRAVLGPRRPSRYGGLRHEPRRDALATIEAAALLLARLEGRPEIEAALTFPFERLLGRYRATRPPAPGGGRRRPRHRVARR
jgi:DTW domain-containing protein